MRIVFLGSPDFALPALRALIAAGHSIVAVVTQPDRPAGRGHAPTPPPVKLLALEHSLQVLQPESVSSPDSVALLNGLRPDVLIVAAFGQILRRNLLSLPARGSLNLHASLLPRYRGASPITAAILAGEEETGVTIMEVVRALDAGPVVASVREPIRDEDTTGSLESRLAEAGARLLLQVLQPWYERRLEAVPQDEQLATYAPSLKREQARIDWRRPATQIWREVRAYNPWPVAFTSLGGQDLRVWDARPLTVALQLPPGSLVDSALLPATSGIEGALFVQTGEGILAVTQLQLAGKKKLAGAEFLRGQRNLLGSVLGG